jgi:hypothetical protein
MIMGQSHNNVESMAKILLWNKNKGWLYRKSTSTYARPSSYAKATVDRTADKTVDKRNNQ